MRYLASGEIFEKMLHLKGFGLYFEGVMNKKWLLSYRNNDISYRDEMLLRNFTSCLKTRQGNGTVS